MVDKKDLSTEVRKEKTIENGISQVVEKDIWAAYNPSAPINRLIVADNDFYRSVHNIVAKKSFSFMPNLLPNSVFHATDKGMKDISKNVMKLAPYNLLEGVAQAGKLIYARSGVPDADRVNYRYLSQAYYLYSSLCVGFDDMGKASLVTACMSVLNHLPTIQQKNKEAIIERLNPRTDDVVNGIIQCVELEPKMLGYDIRPAILIANQPNYVIMPKAWIDYLINSINNMLQIMPCKITYLSPNGKSTTITAFNKPIKGKQKQNILCDYLKKGPSKYGVIQCVDVSKQVITIIPITHFVSMEVIKGV